MNTNCDFVTGHDVVVIQSPPVITKHRGRQRALRTGRMDRGASRPSLGTYRELSDALQDSEFYLVRTSERPVIKLAHEKSRGLPIGEKVAVFRGDKLIAEEPTPPLSDQA